MPELGVVIGIVGDELFTRVMQDQQRALSSMLALQEQGAYDDVWNLVELVGFVYALPLIGPTRSMVLMPRWSL